MGRGSSNTIIILMYVYIRNVARLHFRAAGGYIILLSTLSTIGRDGLHVERQSQ